MNELTPPLSPPDYASVIAAELQLTPRIVAAIIELLDEGATVPFIARYRKEATGGAEDFQISQTLERLQFHRDLFDRKTAILQSIAEQGKLTPELRRAVEATETKTELEDLYLPYRPKRRTRATIAREKGLGPLADRMWDQRDRSGTVGEIAASFVNAEKGVRDVAQALQLARDIVAERIVETAPWRAEIRRLTWNKGRVFAQAAKGKRDEKSKFSDYYDYSEPVSRIPSHRVLAILRGESEGFLSHRILPDPEEAKPLLQRQVLARDRSIWDDEIKEATQDAYDRLLSAQIATDVRAELKVSADREAIEVFATNLRELLMASPFGTRPVMAIDPGFRTGCKVVILGETGRLLEHGVVYPTEPRTDVKGTEAAFDRWFGAHPEIAAVAVGNGTGGRETFSMLRTYLKSRNSTAQAVMVNESGASIYSASETARAELPDHDVTVRGAVSIGRRLQDPLGELVKIDPKSIGVGQYQHDVDQKLLRAKLDDVVVSCVNRVGVDANTASAPLLRYVSGLGAKLAGAIVAHRDEHGPFPSRQSLKKVAGLGAKTFEQAAGFLRIQGKNPLDNSAVHPESYALVKAMAAGLGRSVSELIGDKDTVSTIDLQKFVSDTIGLYTLEDITAELVKPGRDPREEFAATDFREDVHEMADLREGMVLNGTVTNVTHFGAFVDIGVHQDGLVHVSQIANRFVQNPSDELHVGQSVRARVLEFDLGRRRISLTLKDV